MLKKVAVIIESIAIGIIFIKFLWFVIVGNITSESVSKFIAEIFTFAVNESIPLEVTLIQIFGIGGVIILVIDALIGRGN